VTLEPPEQNPKIGIYKTRQVNRLKKLYLKLGKYFNESLMIRKTRPQLRKLINAAKVESKITVLD
jgi:hypothetical protein